MLLRYELPLEELRYPEFAVELPVELLLTVSEPEDVLAVVVPTDVTGLRYTVVLAVLLWV